MFTSHAYIAVVQICSVLGCIWFACRASDCRDWRLNVQLLVGWCSASRGVSWVFPSPSYHILVEMIAVKLC